MTIYIVLLLSAALVLLSAAFLTLVRGGGTGGGRAGEGVKGDAPAQAESVEEREARRRFEKGVEQILSYRGGLE